VGYTIDGKEFTWVEKEGDPECDHQAEDQKVLKNLTASVVIGWVNDSSASGTHTLVPVHSDAYIRILEKKLLNLTGADSFYLEELKYVSAGVKPPRRQFAESSERCIYCGLNEYEFAARCKMTDPPGRNHVLPRETAGHPPPPVPGHASPDAPKVGSVDGAS
jgi:hypothetical protein